MEGEDRNVSIDNTQGQLQVALRMEGEDRNYDLLGNVVKNE